MEVKFNSALLPLRDIVVFPNMVIPLFVGRDKSITALNEVMKGDKTPLEEAGLFADAEITVSYVSSSFTEKEDNCWTVSVKPEPPPPHDAIKKDRSKNCSELFFISNLLMYYSPDGKRR